MNDWWLLIYLLGAGLMAWLIVRMVKGNPQAFSRINISHSITTLGVLTLLIMGVVALGVLMLKH